MLWTPSTNRRSTFVGSIHLLSQFEPRVQFLVDEVMPVADVLVLEADMTDFPEAWGGLPSGDLASIIGPSLWSRVTNLAERLDVDEDYLNTLQAWAAGQFLSIALLRQAGGAFGRGVDSLLREAAESAGTRITYLERPSDQQRACEAAPIVEQIDMLRYVLDHPEQASADFALIQHAWRTFDGQALNALVADRMRRFPITFGLLLASRNRAWVPALTALSQSAAAPIVAVGALHFYGTDGLLNLLRAHGLDLQPVNAA